MPVVFAVEPAHLCYVRASWSDEWVQQPILQCHRVSDALAPSHSSASLTFRYGWAQLPEIGSRPADLAPAVIARPNLLGWYVRVDVSGLGSWYGIIVDSNDRQDGTLDGVPTGVMAYECLGVTFLLDRSPPVVQTKIKTTSGTQLVNLAIPFNGGSDGRMSRDRVAVGNFNAAETCFTDATVTSQPPLWKAKDAIQYLLENFSPKDAGGSAQVSFVVQSTSLDVLDYDLPYLPVHGKTLWQLINEIVDRRRTLIWWFIVNGSDELELIVDSMAVSTISLPSGGEIPANRTQVSYDFETAVNIGTAVLSMSALQYYDQVYCEGNRIGVVFTVSPNLSAGQMIPDWSEDDQTLYNDGASNDTGYSALTDTKKQAADADARARDDVARVFSWWRIGLDWDGKGRNEGGTNHPAVITVDSDCVVDEATVGKFWLDGLRFEEFIPLKPGIDYTGAVTPATDTDDDEQRDYLAPAVWFQLEPVNTETGSVDDGWVHCERINAAVDSGDETRKHQWSVQLRVRDDVPGLVMEVGGNGQQHYIADDEFVSNGAYDDIPDGESVAMRNWIGTFYMLLQQPVFGVWPLTASVTSGDCLRVLRIAIPDAFVDYLVEGTVVKVEAGALHQTDGGFLRDDRNRLNDIARLAYQWYGTPRRTLALNFLAIAQGFGVGTMINAISQGGTSQTINTVISAVTYDLSIGATSLQTQFAEIDFAGLVP